jgi:hypothetical protein
MLLSVTLFQSVIIALVSDFFSGTSLCFPSSLLYSLPLIEGHFDFKTKCSTVCTNNIIKKEKMHDVYSFSCIVNSKCVEKSKNIFFPAIRFGEKIMIKTDERDYTYMKNTIH